MSGFLNIVGKPKLSGLTTLGLGGEAEALVSVLSEEGLEKLPGIVREYGLKTVVLGRGSNILATDDGPVPLLLVRPEFGPEPEIAGEEGGKVLVGAGAGVSLPALVNRTVEWGLAGLAGLAGVPGSVGGAVAMNASSYGAETGACLHTVSVFTPEKGIEIHSRENLLKAGLGYRRFALPQKEGETAPAWFMITGAVFALERGNSAALRAETQSCLERKKATQPVKARSAGCVFKNPASGLSAGKLLDEAGFKGKRLGNMAFSELHANFLINLREDGKSGSAADAMRLINEARAAVLAASGQRLELEVKLWP